MNGSIDVDSHVALPWLPGEAKVENAYVDADSHDISMVINGA